MEYQSALFNFQSLLVLMLLLICTCTYVKRHFPSWLNRNRTGQVKNYHTQTHLYSINAFQ